MVHDVILPLPWRGLAAASTLILALASCEAAGTLAGGGVRSDYLVARQALETGNYDLAIRRYAQMVDQMGSQPSARLRLEYAHALLRGDRHEEAIAAADALIASSDGTIRGSALAVRGTARHEAARRQIDAGQADAATRALLTAAREDLAEFLNAHPALDAAGSMRARRELIDADLRSLG